MKNGYINSSPYSSPINKVNIPLEAFSYALSELFSKFTAPHSYMPIQAIYFHIRGKDKVQTHHYSLNCFLNPNSTSFLKETSLLIVISNDTQSEAAWHFNGRLSFKIGIFFVIIPMVIRCFLFFSNLCFIRN